MGVEINDLYALFCLPGMADQSKPEVRRTDLEQGEEWRGYYFSQGVRHALNAREGFSSSAGIHLYCLTMCSWRKEKSRLMQLLHQPASH